MSVRREGRYSRATSSRWTETTSGCIRGTSPFAIPAIRTCRPTWPGWSSRRLRADQQGRSHRRARQRWARPRRRVGVQELRHPGVLPRALTTRASSPTPSWTTRSRTPQPRSFLQLLWDGKSVGEAEQANHAAFNRYLGNRSRGGNFRVRCADKTKTVYETLGGPGGRTRARGRDSGGTAEARHAWAGGATRTLALVDAGRPARLVLAEDSARSRARRASRLGMRGAETGGDHRSHRDRERHQCLADHGSSPRCARPLPERPTRGRAEAAGHWGSSHPAIRRVDSVAPELVTPVRILHRRLFTARGWLKRERLGPRRWSCRVSGWRVDRRPDDGSSTGA